MALLQGLSIQVFMKITWKLVPLLAFILAGVFLAALSSIIQEVGPEVGTYGNVCGPSGNELCYQELLKGGFPIAYIFDSPGVSVRDQLGFFEDDLYIFPFIMDSLILGTVFWLVVLIVKRTIGSIEHSSSV